MNSEQVYDCPICMEQILCTDFKNIVSTECGHIFHTKCLMMNTAHNGYGCPCCRTTMAEKEESDTESDTESDESDDSNRWTLFDENDEDYTLRGLRFMINRVENEPEVLLEDDHDNEDENLINTVSPPSVEYVMKNMNNYGITIKMLVTNLIIGLDWFKNNSQITGDIENTDALLTEAVENLLTNYLKTGDYITESTNNCNDEIINLNSSPDSKSIRRMDVECIE